jgi:hypothetical protein
MLQSKPSNHSFRSPMYVVLICMACVCWCRVAVDGWIDSPGHRANLLADHTFCGIGVYKNAQGAWYLTQMFALV